MIGHFLSRTLWCVLTCASPRTPTSTSPFRALLTRGRLLPSSSPAPRSNVLGNAYPAYASYKAVLSSSPEEHKQWLTYWLVFTLFTVAEMGGDALVSWLPLYWEAKIVCIVWLSMFGGATQIYNSVVRLFLEKYEDAIDRHVEQISSAAGDKAAELARSGVGAFQANVHEQGRSLMLSLLSFDAKSMLGSSQSAARAPAPATALD